MIEAESCWGCVVGLHEECLDLTSTEDTYYKCCCFSKPRGSDEREFVREIGRPMSNLEDITDVKSTGRKRAAMVAPIFKGMLCEWSGLKYAGGGIQPIVGCQGNTIIDVKRGDGTHLQGDRHHGPDKSTLNNAVGTNLHRICVECHHRYHAINDKYYTGSRPQGTEQWLPDPQYGEIYVHDPDTQAKEEDFATTEEWWSLRSEKRGDYPIKPNTSLRTINVQSNQTGERMLDVDGSEE